MKILVTGGAGFIGSHFVEMLSADGHSITVVDSLTYAGDRLNVNEGRVKFREWSIGDLATHELIRLDKFNLIVNFAAETHVDRSIEDAAPFLTTNILGTHNLLDAVCGSQTRFVQVSTDEVYGSLDSGAFTEKSPLRPSNPYSASKAAADLLCLSYARTHGLDVVITRCSNNYGPRQHPEKLIPKCIEKLNAGQKIQLYGSGLQKRDWIHVKDHCQGIWDAACKGRRGAVYNFGGDCCVSNREVAELIVFLHTGARDYDKHIEYVGDRPGHDFAYRMDYGKAMEDLGWEPTANFVSSLAELIGKQEKDV